MIFTRSLETRLRSTARALDSGRASDTGVTHLSIFSRCFTTNPGGTYDPAPRPTCAYERGMAGCGQVTTMSSEGKTGQPRHN